MTKIMLISSECDYEQYWKAMSPVIIKTSSRQYRGSLYKENTVMGPSYLDNKNVDTGKTTSLYWIELLKFRYTRINTQ